MASPETRSNDVAVLSKEVKSLLCPDATQGVPEVPESLSFVMWRLFTGMGNAKFILVGMENRRNAAKALSVLICVTGILVIAGWIFDIPALTSISPSWISMKFSTAIAFVLSGVTLYFIAHARAGGFDVAQIVLSITSLIISILMGLMFFSGIFGVQTGMETLFVNDPGGINSVVPGKPSVPTMVNFLLMAVAAILTILNPAGLQSKLRIIGIIIGAVGALAIIGYVVNAPMLYYYVADINSAMAMPTALLFVILGAGFVCL
jgi:hypothetical protein